jgi:hypothetical protein
VVAVSLAVPGFASLLGTSVPNCSQPQSHPHSLDEQLKRMVSIKHKSSGMIPERWVLCSRLSSVRFPTNLISSKGTDPVSKLLLSQTYSSRVNLPISLGRRPDNMLPLKSNSRRECSWPNSVGMVDCSRLFSRAKNNKFVSCPISITGRKS